MIPRGTAEWVYRYRFLIQGRRFLIPPARRPVNLPMRSAPYAPFDSKLLASSRKLPQLEQLLKLLARTIRSEMMD